MWMRTWTRKRPRTRARARVCVWVCVCTPPSPPICSLQIICLFFVCVHLLTSVISLQKDCPHGLTFTWWGCCGLCLWHKPTELAHFFLFCSCVCFYLYGPSNCISFHKFSRQLSAFSFCSPGLISALLVLSTIYLFVKVSLSPDIILCGWLGLKHQLTN